jgi:hypothetical protein
MSTPKAATRPSSAKPVKRTVPRAPKITTAAPPAVSTARPAPAIPAAMASESGVGPRRSSAMREVVKIP